MAIVGVKREPPGVRPRDGQESPRFSGIRTFMRLPMRSAPARRLGIVGVPFDTTTSFRPGARFGPEAIRSMSALLRPFHPSHGIDLGGVSAADLGDAPVVPGNVVETYGRVEAFLEPHLTAGTVPICIGGDHSISLATLRALRAVHGPLALVQLDSHGDTWDEYFGERYTHGTVFRRAIEEELIDPAASIQVGLRGSLYKSDDARQSEQLGLEVVSADELAELGAIRASQRILERVDSAPAFISFDVDFVDPSSAPGTGTPEIGGPSSAEAIRLLRALAGLRLVGADCVEVSPGFDGPGQTTALLGATVIWDLMALAAVGPDGNT
jgi:agmatinase